MSSDSRGGGSCDCPSVAETQTQLFRGPFGGHCRTGPQEAASTVCRLGVRRIRANPLGEPGHLRPGNLRHRGQPLPRRWPSLLLSCRPARPARESRFRLHSQIHRLRHAVVAAVIGRHNGYLYPRFLPDGRHFLCLKAGPQERKRMFSSYRWDSKVQKPIAAANSAAIYVPSGHLLNLRGTTLGRRTS